MRHSALLLLLLAPAPLAAQSFLTATVPGAGACVATVGALTESTPFNGGLPVARAYASVGAYSALANVGSTLQNGPSELRFTLSQTLSIASAQPASAAIGPYEVLLVLTTNTTAPLCQYTLSRSFVASPGAPAPSLEIDLFDDGIVDAAGAGGPSLTRTAVTNAGPLRIRLRLSAALSTAVGPHAEVGTELSLRVVPVNGVTVLPSLAGCGLGELEVRAAWDVDGVAVRVAKTQWPGHLQVAVFGLGTSLIPLGPSPASTPLAPCLLLPSPDLLVLLPPAAPFLLPIPPAARPIAIHAQAVLLTPFGLEATNANLVLAQ